MAKTVENSRRQKSKHPYISRRKGVSGGAPVIEGTRIRVAQIAIEYEHMRLSPDEIIQAHPHLTLAQVHDALGYYYEHAEEINASIRADEELVQSLRSELPGSILEEKRGRASDLH